MTKKNEKPLKESVFFSFALIGQIGFATALPLVIFGLLGRYLDKKFGTSPYLFLTGLAFATIQIFFYIKGIIRQANKNLDDLWK